MGALSFVVGIGADLLLSPAFMALEAAVFGVGWVLAPVFSASAFQWTLGCFVALMAVACMASGRVVAKSTPAALLSAEKKPEQLAGASRPALRRLQLAAGVLLVALVWGCVLIEPGLFFGDASALWRSGALWHLPAVQVAGSRGAGLAAPPSGPLSGGVAPLHA